MVKSKYESHVQPNLAQITKWVKEGDTEGLIAKRLGISEAVWYRYKNKHSELRSAIVRGDQEFGLEIRTALRKKAIGYEYQETTLVEEMGPNGPKTQTKVVTKHVSPDVSAIALYMKFAGMLADEELKRAQIDKIKAETEIMKRTGQLDVEDKVGQYLEALEGTFVEEPEEERAGGGMTGIVKTNPLMKSAASIEQEAKQKYGSQFNEEEGRIQQQVIEEEKQVEQNRSISEQNKNISEQNKKISEQNAEHARKLLEEENEKYE